jgi:hypothetical protein
MTMMQPCICLACMHQQMGILEYQNTPRMGRCLLYKSPPYRQSILSVRRCQRPGLLRMECISNPDHSIYIISNIKLSFASSHRKNMVAKLVLTTRLLHNILCYTNSRSSPCHINITDKKVNHQGRCFRL